jgi:hypothetical protein
MTVRRRRQLATAGLTVGLVAILLGMTLAAAPAEPAPTPAFTKTETISRTHVNADGSETVADTRTFTVSVDANTKLRGDSIVNVSWFGAHPTLGRASNPNSAAAEFTEYPVVLMQCRGDDTAGAPTDPSTCWTQTIDERKHETSSLYPPWRVDRYATTADRQQLVGYPDPRPAGCSAPVQPTAHYEPFDALDGTVYRPLGGAHTRSFDCGPVLAPEMVTVEQPDAPPGNTTYGVSDAQGAGTAKFVVESADENASLGCSDTVKCSLVVIPVMGISCDPAGSGVPADQVADVNFDCRAAGRNQPGQILAPPSEFSIDPAVAGELWWSESNWRNRITIPLSFSPSTSVCSNDNRVPLDLFGSELMDQATQQWSPAFCTDPTRFKFRHVLIGEPQAKSVLNAGSGEAAMVSFAPPDGYAKPTVNAPIGVSGFAISYAIDDANGKPYTNLKLTPRLIAKLLTESYPANNGLKADFKLLPPSNPYFAMQNNPVDLSLDPEFQALNPGIGDRSINGAPTSSTMLALSGTSDVTFALTSYINADPEARAWLNGAPDPWGMVVNPGYKNIALPVPLWPLSDTFVSTDVSFFGSCLLPEQWHALPAQPMGPLIASPLPSLGLISQRIQFANSNVHSRCSTILDDSGAVLNVTLSTVGRQSPGFRFIIGITTLADADFFQLDRASLQSRSTITDFKTKFTDGTGRTFIAPSDASLRAAMALAQPDEATGTWLIPYDKLRGTQGNGAYPGTMPIFLSAPTMGLPADDAANLAKLMKFAVGDGQTPGSDIGQLPAGYLPLTAANGLAPLVSYTLRAADAVLAQDGELPGLVPPTTTPTPSHTTSPPNNTGSGSTNNGGGSANNNGGGNNTGGIHVPPPPTPSSTIPVLTAPPTTPPPQVFQPVGHTGALPSFFAGWALPIVLIVGFVAAILGAAARFVILLLGTRRGRQ